MSIPGFRRGSRWTSTLDGEGFFVLYELETYEILTSRGYLDRLNAPTVWSTKMMPHHLNMVRSQCRVGASFGGGVATSLATIRLSPEAGREAGLETAVVATLRELASKPGLTGAHLLITDTPKTGGPTTEQQIRGLDGAADWIVLLSGYDPQVVELVVSGKLSTPALRKHGRAGESHCWTLQARFHDESPRRGSDRVGASVTKLAADANLRSDTKRTNRAGLAMSVHWGRPEVAGRGAKRHV